MQLTLRITKKVVTAIALLLLLTQHLQAQTTTGNATTTITGSVTDEAKQPLEGVSILAGKKALGITNKNGSFTVTVNSNTRLLFTSVGYETYSLTAATTTSSVKITLKRTDNALQDVVVTALGIKREARGLGYSAPVVTGEELTTATSANWTDALSGKVAGLNLVRSNSGPTGSNKIILRGENNLTGENEALIVVDGVVISQSSGRRNGIAGETVYGTGSDNMPADYGSSINDINPEDIETVTVLKGRELLHCMASGVQMVPSLLLQNRVVLKEKASGLPGVRTHP